MAIIKESCVRRLKSFIKNKDNTLWGKGITKNSAMKIINIRIEAQKAMPTIAPGVGF